MNAFAQSLGSKSNHDNVRQAHASSANTDNAETIPDKKVNVQADYNGPQHNTVRWSSLPPEVLLQIVQFADREILKCMRLTSRMFHEIATPLLFYTLHYSPTTTSHERLKRIRANLHLAQHVRRFTLHKGSWALDSGEFDYSQLLRTRGPNRQQTTEQPKPLTSDRGTPASSQSTRGKSDQELDANLLEEIYSEIQFTQIYGSNLPRILEARRTFPNLDQVYLPHDSDIGRSEYYARKCGRNQSKANDRIVKWDNVFRCLDGIPLRVIDFHGVDSQCMWLETMPSQQAKHEERFGQLQVLRLSLENASQFTASSGSPERLRLIQDICAGFGNVLQACAHSLRELSIQIGPKWFHSKNEHHPRQSLISTHEEHHVDSSYESRLTKTITQRVYPLLTDLMLTNFETDENDLLTFLSKQPQLTRLSLTNWTMCVPVDMGQNAMCYPASSIIRAIWNIPKVTSLHHAHLQGYFRTMSVNCRLNQISYQADHGTRDRLPKRSNFTSPAEAALRVGSKSETEHAFEEDEPITMLSKLESYLVHKSPFPFAKQLEDTLEREDEVDLSVELQQPWKSPDTTSSKGGTMWTLDAHPLAVIQSDPTWLFVDSQRDL